MRAAWVGPSRQSVNTNTRLQFTQTTRDKTNKALLLWKVEESASCSLPPPSTFAVFLCKLFSLSLCFCLWASFVSFLKRQAPIQIPQSTVLLMVCVWQRQAVRQRKSLPDAAIIANKDLLECFSIFTGYCLDQEMALASRCCTKGCVCVRFCPIKRAACMDTCADLNEGDALSKWQSVRVIQAGTVKHSTSLHTLP